MEDSAAATERKLVRKVDVRILPFLTFLYVLSYLDRANIGNAANDLKRELKLSESQYSTAVGVFYIGYILLEIPSNLVLKKVRASRILGLIVLAWGLASTACAFVTNFNELVLVRTALGCAESGFFPGVVLYLSFWYQKEETGLRLALFYSSVAIAGAVGGVLAWAILRMNAGGLDGWQWLFLLEGIPSVVAGVVTILVLPDSIESSGWLSAEERGRLRARLTADAHTDPAQLRFSDVLQTLLLPRLWGFMALFLTLLTPAYAISFYLPSILTEAGYSTLTANLLTVPVYVVTTAVIIGNALVSDRRCERGYHIAGPAALSALGFAALTAASWYHSATGAYISMFACAAGVYSAVPLVLSWVSATMQSSTERAVGAAAVISFGNLGGLIGPQLYSLTYQPAIGEDIQEDGVESKKSSGSYVYGHVSMTVSLTLAFALALALRRWTPRDKSHGAPGVPLESSPLLATAEAP